jgi:hypothetical protein
MPVDEFLVTGKSSKHGYTIVFVLFCFYFYPYMSKISYLLIFFVLNKEIKNVIVYFPLRAVFPTVTVKD